MTAILDGVRILEVAEHTFVPAASAALADLGAEVIKIEHVERGDAMRGLAASGIAVMGGDIHALLEHSNRGKKSLALDLTQDEGLEILHNLIATSDVFLTNKQPSVRVKLRVGLEDVRAHNDKIIYVRGTGQGERGPDADKGSYDSLAFWARAGTTIGRKRPEYDLMPMPPAPGYGDSLGAITIAGGILGALFHRERTGQATVVDVSLFGTGLWAMGQAMALSLLLDMPWQAPSVSQMGGNPLTRNYRSKDGRDLAFTCLQAGRCWPTLCDAIDRPDLRDDERFADMASLFENGPAAIAELTQVFASADVGEWRERLADWDGQWVVVQHTLEAAEDPQTVANGYLQECETASGSPFHLVTVPMQYDEEPARANRAPDFNEHGDDILAELGFDWDTIVDLKVRGVTA